MAERDGWLRDRGVAKSEGWLANRERWVAIETDGKLLREMVGY
jgi:hypothetical protein